MSQTAKSSAMQVLGAAGAAAVVALLLGLLIFFTRSPRPQKPKPSDAPEVAASPEITQPEVNSPKPKAPAKQTSAPPDEIADLFKDGNFTAAAKRPSAPSATLTYQLDDGVSPPTVLFKLEPDYTREAIRGKVQGDVTLSLKISESGNPENVKVTHSLGQGLDAEAVKAIQQWHFKPAATKDDKPIAVDATIDVNFRLP